MTGKNISNAVSNISDRYIEEAADFYSGTQRMRKSFSMRKAVATAAAILLIGTVAAPVVSVPILAAADVDQAYELLYMVSPVIAQKLKPVRMFCEDNGIRIEVVSAVVEGNEANIQISVQDLTGNRIDETTDLFDSAGINTPFDCSISCRSLGYDAETKTAMFLVSISQWDEQDIVGDNITFRVREMLSNKQEYTGPLTEVSLKETGSECGTKTFVPSQIRGGGGLAYEAYAKDFRALVSDGILCAPVAGVAITASGYVNETLHIQARYDSILETDNHGYVYFKNSEGDSIHSDASVSWFGDEAKKDCYEEYIFDLTDRDVKEYELYGYFVTSDTHITGDWSVTFPLEEIRP